MIKVAEKCLAGLIVEKPVSSLLHAFVHQIFKFSLDCIFV